MKKGGLGVKGMDCGGFKGVVHAEGGAHADEAIWREKKG